MVEVYDAVIIKTCLVCDQPDKYTRTHAHKKVTETVLKDVGAVKSVPCYHLAL